MLTKEEISSLRERLRAVYEAGTRYFEHADPVRVDAEFGTYSWAVASQDVQDEGEELRRSIKSLSVDIAGAARGAPLMGEADLQDLRHNTRQMLANVHYNRYRHWGVHIHHDEDVVLGVDPPSQDEVPVDQAATASNLFDVAANAVNDLIDLLSPADTVQRSATGRSSYRPNTAFIMMAIDKHQPDLEDVKNSIKEVCKEFGIQATTADEIEHDGRAGPGAGAEWNYALRRMISVNVLDDSTTVVLARSKSTACCRSSSSRTRANSAVCWSAASFRIRSMAAESCVSASCWASLTAE